MINSERQQVIIIPGKSDGTLFIEKATHHWKRRGLDPVITPVGWSEGLPNFDTMLARLVDRIDELSENGPVYLVGTSAGGGAAFNAFLERPRKVIRAASLIGRLKRGLEGGSRSLEKRTLTSPAFRQSVEMFEDRIQGISPELLQRMMSVRPKFGDQYVPREAFILEGALNYEVPTGEHGVSIGAALISRRVKDFLQFGR